MPFNRRDFLKASAAGAVVLKQGRMALDAPAENIQVAIDATKPERPSLRSFSAGTWSRPRHESGRRC